MTEYLIESFEALNVEMHSISQKQSTLLIGIDGRGGSGKSMFARALERFRPNISVVEMDDFFLPSSQRPTGDPLSKPIGGDFDWQRVYNQVLTPLSQDHEGRYQRYDWDLDELAEWHTLTVGGIVIIEGIYSTRNELADMYDFKVWVECPRDIRLARGIARDGEAAREIWENDWMVIEDRYAETHRPFERANLLIDGSAKLNYDPSYQFIRFIK